MVVSTEMPTEMPLLFTYAVEWKSMTKSLVIFWFVFTLTQDDSCVVALLLLTVSSYFLFSIVGDSKLCAVATINSIVFPFDRTIGTETMTTMFIWFWLYPFNENATVTRTSDEALACDRVSPCARHHSY